MATLAILATFTTAFAAPPQDTEVGLGEVGLPVYGAIDVGSGYTQPTAAYPISAAHAPVLPAEQVTATSTKDTQVTWTLAAWTVGRTLSEQKPGAKIGDFCSNIPSADTIDWARTIEANADQIAAGRLLFDTGATNPTERVLFTASGATTVKWVKNDGSLAEEQTYKVGAMASSRPYRIFATRSEEANSAAYIDLSGKFVRFFGDSQLLSSEWRETSGGVSNVVYGLDYNPSVSKLLTFRYTVDEKTGTIRCPQGQFVLAYYDTETKDHIAAHIVVEVCPPTVNTLYAGVGDSLAPAGGGYSVSNLFAAVVAGLSRETSDPYSPYLEQYTAETGEEVTDPDHGKIFAIAPTDVTTSPAGIAMPWKADIYWQTADPMKTKWTFEHDWYLISWPEKPIRVVVAPSDATPGCPFMIPTNYLVSTLFRMPENVSADVDQQSGEVELRGGSGGKILIRLTDDSGTGCPWYLPVEMVDYRDEKVATPWTIDWPVGVELTPRLGIEVGPLARAMSERVDDKLPGFIYEPESPGRNWNPRLYHRPAGSSGLPDVSAVLDVDGSAAQNADPYAALESSIYAVNANDGKIQVWWRANFQDERMPTAVTYPALVQNYRASWETTMADGLLPEIALASGLGSADPAMTACSGRSLLLEEAGSTASMNLGGAVVYAEADAVRAGFALYVPENEPVTPGRLARLVFGDKNAPNAAVMEARLERTGEDGWQVVFTGTGAGDQTTPVKAGQWNAVLAKVPPAANGHGITATFGAVEGEDGAAATFVALDRLALWYGDSGAPETENDVIFNFSFTDDDLATLGTNGTVRTALDAKGNTLRCVNCATLGMGAPKPFSLRLAAEGGVSPEIYYQNVQGAIGFNPNEEHAFLEANGSEYVVWALRNDFNQFGLSDPVVMVMYPRNGKGAMQAYRVAAINAAHSDLVRTVTVGNMMLPPGPISKVPGWGTDNDLAVTPFLADDASVVYIDRKNQMWARRAGIAFAAYSYPLQPGFYCPSLGDNQLPAGTIVGWMNCAKIPAPSATDIQNGMESMTWTWLSQWPDPASVPTMRVGQVLTVAEKGLPEVWNAASMAVAYPSPSDGLRTVVQLIDPTTVQCSEEELPISANFAEEYGFEVGPSGTAILRKGKYYFTGLPPSISDRFYIDTNADPAFRVCLAGRRVVKESGDSYLQLNVLTDAERAALKAICTLDASEDVHKTYWDKAIDSLAKEEVVPSIRSGLELTAKNYTISKTYAFPSQKAFDAWTNQLDTVNFKVESVKSDLTFEYQVVTGPMLPIAGIEHLCATCSWEVVSIHRYPKFITLLFDQSERWEKDGLAEYTGLKWEEEIADSGSGGLYLEVEVNFTTYIADRLPTTIYLPRDHYALVANGAGDGWVTLVENDNPDPQQVKPGLPVSMKVLRVLPELHVDGIAVLTDPLNKLSEELTLQYRTPLGSATSNFEFEWRRATPAADGTLSTSSYERPPWEYYRGETGLYSILLGAKGARPDEYVNTYYTLRYRARPGTLAAFTVGTEWSDWAPEQLAEGWLQRVLNEVTPFAQRVEDFYEHKADSWYSMLEEIGRPYQGDVALNNDNLTQVGLLELYQTLFNRAESVLQASGSPDVDLSKQLLLAQTRMGEFYSLLGAEAYSDAKNPLVAQQSLDVLEGSAINLPSSVFCFANQVPTLLDEELALLRGRSASTAYPRMTEAPCYNRLAWNLTKGISEGEVAYVANYGVRARDGILDVNCAAAQYPQGHGDAWGYYLSELSGYYRLLRNPLFDWTAAMGEMLMDQKLMNVDYQDEEKFADAVAKIARIGLDTMDLTVRKHYRDNDGVAGGYRDSNADQAFGYGEWATRTGLAAAYGWMTANALLPTNDAPYKAFTDKGIMKIDRTTAAQLPVICDTVRSLENRLAATEAGLNPLGLSDNAVPFDIDPDRLEEKDSHFDQILERAEKALANCKTALDYANKYGNRIAQLSKEETTLIAEITEQELAYNNQLIAIYGTPFSGDIGPGGTYPQGYEGPDLYNYNYMDLEPFGLDELVTAFTNSWTLQWGNALGFCDMKIEKSADGKVSLQGIDLGVNVGDIGSADEIGLVAPYLPDKLRRLLVGTGSYEFPIEFSLSYNVSEGGIRAKPLLVTGNRATEGSIQAAYREYLIAYKEVQNAIFTVDLQRMLIDMVWDLVKVHLGKDLPLMISKAAVSEVGLGTALLFKNCTIETAKLAYEHAYKEDSLTAAAIPAVVGAGTTVINDPRSVKEAASAAGVMAGLDVAKGILDTAIAAKTKIETGKGYLDVLLGLYETANGIYDAVIELRDKVLQAALQFDAAVVTASEKFAALATAEAAYRTEVYKGEMLQDERAAWRRKIASKATARRYLDMYNRVERNAALAKYSTAFDTAQRYVWELAKVYDYETGLLSTDPQSGKKFLAEIIATRSLGEEGVTIDSTSTDGGLYDIVHRMKENWNVLKGRYGINNPDKPEKWFSLRYERFRIRPDAAGDDAWRRELKKCWVADLRSNPDFVRHCQPLASEAVVVKEPGLIIPFSTSINNAENFFGKTLQGGESQFSSADYATKIAAVGVDFVGYDDLTTQTAAGLAVEPNVYLVPVGYDYMRAPAGSERKLVKWNVVDQVLPLPYKIGSTQLDDAFWISSFSGLDGTSDSVATIRRHSTLRVGDDFNSTRLVGRSVWNDHWILVIPASALGADRERAIETFIDGVGDIKIGIRAYSRQGN